MYSRVNAVRTHSSFITGFIPGNSINQERTVRIDVLRAVILSLQNKKRENTMMLIRVPPPFDWRPDEREGGKKALIPPRSIYASMRLSACLARDQWTYTQTRHYRRHAQLLIHSHEWGEIVFQKFFQGFR